MPNTQVSSAASVSQSPQSQNWCAGKTAGEEFPSFLWSPVPLVCMTVECPWPESPWANRTSPVGLCSAQLGWRNSQLSVPCKVFRTQYSSILDNILD